MLSTVLELVGLAALAVATFLLAGLAPLLLLVGVECLLLGVALDPPVRVSRKRR